MNCIQLRSSQILQVDNSVIPLLALQLVAIFFGLPKLKHLILRWVLPHGGNEVFSSGAVPVTFDYGLEGKEQQHNNLISNRWLRSSKGLFCLGACSSGWPGCRLIKGLQNMVPQQRQLSQSTAYNQSATDADRCHILASWEVRPAYWSRG